MSKRGGKKINEREQKLLYILGGVVLVVVAFQLVFKPYQEKKTKLADEMVQLTLEIANMQQMKENETTYVARTEEMQAEIEEIFDMIPPNITSEDQIIYAKNIETAYDDIEISSLGLTEGTLLYTMNEDGNNPGDDGKFLYASGVTIECTTGYKSLKDCLRDIANDKKRRSIDNITVKFDSEKGNLTGSMTVNTFFLLGSDREYVPEIIDSVVTGTKNIFGKSKK